MKAKLVRVALSLVHGVAWCVSWAMGHPEEIKKIVDVIKAVRRG